MKYRKTVFTLCIVLGAIMGVVLSNITGELLLGALLFGAILGVLFFVTLFWIIARRRTSLQPYDGLDEHHQVNNPINLTPEDRLRGIQDGHIDQYMPFHLPKR